MTSRNSHTFDALSALWLYMWPRELDGSPDAETTRRTAHCDGTGAM